MISPHLWNANRNFIIHEEFSLFSFFHFVCLSFFSLSYSLKHLLFLFLFSFITFHPILPSPFIHNCYFNNYFFIYLESEKRCHERVIGSAKGNGKVSSNCVWSCIWLIITHALKKYINTYPCTLSSHQTSLQKCLTSCMPP